jgi:hypothetical protein
MIAPGEPLIKVDVGLSAGAVGSRQHQGCRLAGRRGRRALGLDHGGQLLAVPADRPLDRLGEVLPQVPAVRDLVSCRW